MGMVFKLVSAANVEINWLSQSYEQSIISLRSEFNKWMDKQINISRNSDSNWKHNEGTPFSKATFSFIISRIGF